MQMVMKAYVSKQTTEQDSKKNSEKLLLKRIPSADITSHFKKCKIIF